MTRRRTKKRVKIGVGVRKHGRYSSRTRSHRMGKIGVSLSRTGDKGSAGFRVCVSGVGKSSNVCERGKNPRTALAKAFRKAASAVSKRSGAFKGW